MKRFFALIIGILLLFLMGAIGWKKNLKEYSVTCKIVVVGKYYGQDTIAIQRNLYLKDPEKIKLVCSPGRSHGNENTLYIRYNGKGIFPSKELIAPSVGKFWEITGERLKATLIKEDI